MVRYLDKERTDFLIDQIKANIGLKQDKLIAGDNITITNNTISANVSDGSGAVSSVNGKTGKVVLSGNDIIVGGTKSPVRGASIGAGFDAFTDYVTDLINDNTTNKNNIANLTNNKQNKLTPGTNITIDGNTINATIPSVGGEGLMPVNNGQLGNYTEKLVNINDGNINLELGNVFLLTLNSNTTLNISNAKVGSHSFTLYINVGTLRAISYPSNVRWLDNKTPDIKANKIYTISFDTIDRGTTWLGNWGEY